jgi:hypothetical protein
MSVHKVLASIQFFQINKSLKIDIQSAIIALSLILVSGASFCFIIRNNKRKANQFIQTLQDMAQKNSMAITQYDVWNHAAIGTDHNMDMIFFTKRTKDDVTQLQISLNDI